MGASRIPLAAAGLMPGAGTRRVAGLSAFALAALALPCAARAYTISAGTLVEDFSSLDGADLSSGVTTGVWNVVSRVARAGAVANGQAARAFSFGDGSDGAVSSSAGYTFNTNLRPNGFNFTSVSITGGTVTVTGSYPLIIRSLGSVTITPGISVTGPDASGVAGVANGATAERPGGTAVACPSQGGTGGAATPANGGNSKDYTGSFETVSTGGALLNGAGNASDGANGTLPIGGDFDVAGNFVCGSGGGGGGGHVNGMSFSSGGSGGAGGGALRIAAVGPISIGGSLVADGGEGGAGVSDGGGCSGNGSGGNGGVIWLQTLGALTAPAPSVDGGTGQSAGGGCNAGVDGSPGLARGDGASAGGAMALTYATTNAAPNQQYTVQSKAYDLGTYNARFDGADVTSAASGGSVSLLYAGSADNVSWSDWTSDITALSDRDFRYVKFRIVIATGGVAAASPTVSRVAIRFADLGPGSLDFTLKPGCARTRDVRDAAPGSGAASGPGREAARGPLAFAAWALAVTLAALVRRRAS